MVDSEYSTDNYKSSKISIRAVPDLYLITLTTKKMCKHGVKKLPFVIRYVPDRHET